LQVVLGVGLTLTEQNRIRQLGSRDGQVLLAIPAFVLRGHRFKGHGHLQSLRDHEARQREVEDFWLSTLALPRTQLRKSTINRYSKYSQKKRRNKLPYGTCRVVVCDTALVQNLYGVIQEYGGFEREEWLM